MIFLKRGLPIDAKAKAEFKKLIEDRDCKKCNRTSTIISRTFKNPRKPLEGYKNEPKEISEITDL
jgi:hypothetical protein